MRRVFAILGISQSYLSRGVFAAAISLLATVPALAQSFFPIKEQEFLANVGGLFTAGGQYMQPGGSAGNLGSNGVLQNSWSMLVRWQDPTFIYSAFAGNLGALTGFQPPDPKDTWQRGRADTSPIGPQLAGVQLYGTQAGMLINTWNVGHVEVVGGGYNDMYGYAWAQGQRPDAFRRDTGSGTVPSHLVLQANVAVPSFTSWKLDGTWQECANAEQCADGQVGLFAYLEDRTRMDLPPIAYVALLYGSRANGSCGPSGGVASDYAGGVWFGAVGICTTDISTAIVSTTTQNTTFSYPAFFRIHITPLNWTNLINRINSAGPSNPNPSLHCNPGSTCPPTGYSNNPDNYRIQYAGVIAEASLLEPNPQDPNDRVRVNGSGIRQALLAATMQSMGIYRATDPPPAPPATVTALDWDGQFATLGSQFQYPLRVRVTDAGGNPVNGATVTFSGPATGASISPNPVTATTNYLGEASVTLTANGIAGQYPVTAMVSGATSAYFTLTNNTAPTISLSTNGTTFTPSTPVVLTANAGDVDGSISQVAFYANGQPLFTDGAAPYTFTWNAPTGNYQLVAVAFDDHNAYAYSNYVNIVVNPDPSCTPGPVNLDYSGIPLAPNTSTGDIPAPQGWTITFAFTANPGAQSSFRESYNSWYAPQPARMEWSVSKCKGDFTGTGVCYPGMQYTNGGMDVVGFSYPWMCEVQPGITYYLNLRVNTCSSGSCGFKIDRWN
jgi:hypothetical protein